MYNELCEDSVVDPQKQGRSKHPLEPNINTSTLFLC